MPTIVDTSAHDSEKLGGLGGIDTHRRGTDEFDLVNLGHGPDFPCDRFGWGLAELEQTLKGLDTRNGGVVHHRHILELQVIRHGNIRMPLGRHPDIGHAGHTADAEPLAHPLSLTPLFPLANHPAGPTYARSVTSTR